MTQPERIMQDLSKGYVPIIFVLSIIGTALVTGMWVSAQQADVRAVSGKVTELQTQLSQISGQVATLSIALAKGQPLPENVAYKADILRFCVENRQLKCPVFER